MSGSIRPDENEPWDDLPGAAEADAPATLDPSKWTTGQKFTTARQQEFCKHLVETGDMTLACLRTGVHPSTVAHKKASVKEFAADCELALQEFRASIEDAIYGRAVRGWDEPVWHNGEQVGSVRRHSDRLLELLAKRHIPEYTPKLKVDQRSVSAVAISDLGAALESMSPEVRAKFREAFQAQLQSREEEET